MRNVTLPPAKGVCIVGGCLAMASAVGFAFIDADGFSTGISGLLLLGSGMLVRVLL
jgi:hypothetical protein